MVCTTFFATSRLLRRLRTPLHSLCPCRSHVWLLCVPVAAVHGRLSPLITPHPHVQSPDQDPLGDITVRLYDETPLHRDNFLKLAREGYYDGTLFHRVIKNFMVQGGDPDSRGASPTAHLGAGGPDYTIPAEFNKSLIHKKGALAAARQGDEVNPEKRSSGSQFYIVTGEIYSAGKLTQLERQMAQQQLQNIFNGLVVENRSRIIELRKNRDNAGLMALQEDLQKKTYALAKEQGEPKYTPEQREVYTSIGGTPFLDQNYTVFGEVEEGLDVVEKIQLVRTQPGDRPVEDITMQVSVLED